MILKPIKKIITEHFFTNPRAQLRVREIERVLKLPLPSVIRYCKELERERILGIVKLGTVNLYTADRSSAKFILEKRLFNIKRIYDSGLIEFVKQELSDPPIVIFGSFEKGEDVEGSDVDLYIETLSNKKIALGKFEKFLSRTVHVFRYKSIKEIPSPHLANNIINGITLNNSMEVFK